MHVSGPPQLIEAGLFAECRSFLLSNQQCQSIHTTQASLYLWRLVVM